MSLYTLRSWLEDVLELVYAATGIVVCLAVMATIAIGVVYLFHVWLP